MAKTQLAEMLQNRKSKYRELLPQLLANHVMKEMIARGGNYCFSEETKKSYRALRYKLLKRLLMAQGRRPVIFKDFKAWNKIVRKYVDRNGNVDFCDGYGVCDNA